MRTTIDLPESLHSIATGLACYTGHTLSQAVADLMQRGLAARSAVFFESLQLGSLQTVISGKTRFFWTLLGAILGFIRLEVLSVQFADGAQSANVNRKTQ